MCATVVPYGCVAIVKRSKRRRKCATLGAHIRPYCTGRGRAAIGRLRPRQDAACGTPQSANQRKTKFQYAAPDRVPTWVHFPFQPYKMAAPWPSPFTVRHPVSAAIMTIVGSADAQYTCPMHCQADRSRRLNRRPCACNYSAENGTPQCQG
jgi:hypothetical protein